MHLSAFEHLRPTSIEEAAQMLQDIGPRARLVAGGTDLLPRIKLGLTRPDVVISLKAISPHRPPAIIDGDLYISAMMSLAEIASSPEIIDEAPVLAEAALSVGSNQIRQMGTLGGNICLENRCSYYNQTHTFQFIEPCFKRRGDRCYLIPKGKKCLAVFMADTVPALVCLNASAAIVSPDIVRKVAVEKLYTGNALQPLTLREDEIINEVIIPPTAAIRGAAFSKFSIRGGMEFAALSVAVLLEMASDHDICAAARIVVGSVASRPLRAAKAEAAVAGKRITQKLLEEIAHLAAGEIQPIMHHGYSVAYLKACLKIQVFRTAALAAERTGKFGGT